MGGGAVWTDGGKEESHRNNYIVEEDVKKLKIKIDT